MKTISISNLKGGVAKTISAANIAHILSTVHGKRILLIDNDDFGVRPLCKLQSKTLVEQEK